MGIVRFALKYPHTFYVVAALILFLGVTAAVEMPTDIFPEIDIPVVSVIWQYTGLNTTEMEQRFTTYSQYAISSNVNGIKDIEAETVNGISVQKLYFQPDVNLSLAISQTVAATNAIRALLPTGTQPPIVVQYSASAVPVLQIALSSNTLSEAQLYDYGIYRLRQMLAPIHGVTLPTPAGGKYRQIMVDIDPIKLLSKGLTPLQVVNAVNAQNLTLPGGDEKIGKTDYTVRTNSMPPTIEALNDIPVTYQNGATVFLRDIGHVRDGNLVQQNIVRADGKASVLLSIIKNGNASTLTVVNAVKHMLNIAREAAPPGMVIKSLFDQSVFVTSSLIAVLREGATAAGLTALMILLFLGSWRPTVVVMISIPLAMLTSLVVLYFLGETINTMTLGGLALAVGILVDDSTVTIENTYRLLDDEKMPLPRATLHGAAEIAVPTLVSTLAISCVFTSVVFLEGPAKYLFTPLGLSVVFAMLASYGLSRTLTPITIGQMLKGQHRGGSGPLATPPPLAGYGIHTNNTYLSMTYDQGNVESGDHRREPIPTGAHRLGPGRLVVAIPAAQPGDNPRQPRQGAGRVGILLTRRPAFESWRNRIGGLQGVRAGNIGGRSGAARAGIDQLDRAHRGADGQRPQLEQAVGVMHLDVPAIPDRHFCWRGRPVRCASAADRFE